MARLAGAELTERVQRFVRERAAELGLDPKHAHARYILNLGGFGNTSFHLTDGAKKLHLKLCCTNEDEQRLRRWEAVAPTLESRYRAPRMLGWIKLPGTLYRGPLFEHIDGGVLDAAQADDVVPKICTLLAQLHGDCELSQQIRSADAPATHRDCFRMRFEQMYAEDLAAVRADRPPFVSADTLKWLEEESQRVLSLADADQSFDGRAEGACHWDLWSGNVLAGADGNFHVIDWDCLALGDPAIDYATIVLSLYEAQADWNWRMLPIAADADAAFAARMEIYLRAITLDWAIDVLADWTDCAILPPEHRETIQHRSERLHRQFLDQYRRNWSS